MEQFKSSRSLNAVSKLTCVSKFSLHNVASKESKGNLKKFLSSYTGLLDVFDSLGRTPLVCAMLNDKRDSVILLKNAGANVNTKDVMGRTALHLAAEYELFDYIKLLVACGGNAKLADNDGVTALHICSVHSSPKCLRQVLQYYGPEEVDVQDKDLRTALHWSACCGNVVGLKLLLKYNCNIGIPDIKGMTPLHWAAISDNPKAPDCVKYLLRNRPNVINWCDNDGQTAFHLAVAQNDQRVLQELMLCRHGNVNVTDNRCRTPLHLASLLGLSDVVVKLLNEKANISSCDIDEATALHYAAAGNSVSCVEVLLSKGIEVNHKDSKGRNAVAWAVCKRSNDALKVLHTNRADFVAVDEHGRSALHLAAAFGSETTVEILIDYDLNVNAIDCRGRTPLFEACNRNHYRVAEFLLRYGAKRDLTDDEGQTALHCAATKDETELCQLLVSHGYNVDSVDIWGRTPLFYAAFVNNVDCVEYLIETGANPHHCDNQGFTCLHWACRKGHFEMVKCLLRYGVDPNTLKLGNRLTALDFSYLGEHHHVTHYLLGHGALSMVHIENMAATKIQRAFRRYRNRIKKSKSPTSRDTLSIPNNPSKDVAPVIQDNVRKILLNSENSFKTCSTKRCENKSESSEASQSTSGVSCCESELNLSAEIFNFLHENPTRTINFNRKTELRGSNSVLNLTGTNITNNMNFFTNLKPTEEAQVTTIPRKNVFRQKHKKKMDVVQQKCELYRHVFDSFVYNIVNIQDRMMIENGDSAKVNYENCQELILPYI
ncbi:hypothetical protein CHUAL_002671 [Chamberlinius hualienensis]